MRLNETLKLQIKSAAEGRFTLGSSQLGEAYLASNSDIVNDTAYDWVDVLEGTQEMRLVRGVNAFAGVEALPIASAGSLRVRTTNRILDPYNSPYMKPKKQMRLITADGDLIFRGKVDNISVDYRSDKSDPIISFDIVDPIADLQQASTKLDSLSNNKTWTQRINEILNNSKKSTITRNVVGGGTIKHGYWGDNRTVWEALVLAQTTESGFIYFDRNNDMWAYGKGAFTPPPTPWLQFSNIDTNKLGYKDIIVDANSDSVINEIQVSNAELQSGEAAFEVLGPYRRNVSINTYGAHVYNANTNFYRGANNTDNTQVEAWANNILNKNSTPQIIIKEITWDGKKDVYSAALSDIGDTVAIEYVSEFLSIDRDLTIVGIEHLFTADDDKWRVTFTLFEQGRFS
jgi:hypothetical protein